MARGHPSFPATRSACVQLNRRVLRMSFLVATGQHPLRAGSVCLPSMIGQDPSRARATTRWQKRYLARHDPPAGARHTRPSIQLWSSHLEGEAARCFEQKQRSRIGSRAVAKPRKNRLKFGAKGIPNKRKAKADRPRLTPGAGELPNEL